MEANETKVEEPVKIYDLEKGWVEKPKDVEFANATFTPPKTDPPTGTEPAKTEPETPPAEGTKTDVVKTDPPASTFAKEKFSKYGIEKEEDVFSTLDNLDSLMKENDELKKRPTEPQFKTETHKKLYSYLEQYPESTWNEVLKTGGEILGMDPDAADGTKILQEAFVLQHPMVSREEAIMLFQDEHEVKYNLKPKEEYEDPAKYDRDKKLNETRMKIEVDKARNIVREAKGKLTVEKKTETPASREIPAETIQNYTQEVEKVLDGTNKGTGLAFLDKDFIRVKSDEKGTPIINIQLPADKLKELRETAVFHLKNKSSYDNNGKISNFDAAKDTLRLAFALFPEWISQQMAKQVDTLANIKKAEEIASATPDKIETVKGKDVTTMSIDEQARELAKKEKEARERGQQPRR